MFSKTQWAMLVIALFLCSCSSEELSIDSDARVLAGVNNESITVTWFEQTYVNYLMQTGENDTARNRAIHLDNMIDAILLSEEAVAQGITEQESYQLFLARERKSILGDRYFKEEFIKTLPPPTDEEIRQSFARWKDKAVVRHLFYTDPEEAHEAYDRLVAGRDFLEEAQQNYGLVKFDSSAGFLGPIRYFGVDDAFAEAAFELGLGEFSEPIRTRFGFHIIRLENRIQEALLTESEYQARRSGIDSQFRLRRRRLEGDRFILSFMQDRNVLVEAPAIRALQSLLQEFAHTVNPAPTVSLGTENRFKTDSLKAVMNAGTVLATYEWNGQTNNFTAGDYLFWLEKLPFQEALNRTAASVGRAMRNEVLARAGEDSGHDDTLVQSRLEREALQERARLFQEALRKQTDVELDDELIRNAYQALGYDRRRLFQADFDVIEFPTLGEAERLRQVLESNPDHLIYTSNNVLRYQDVNLTDVPEWLPHVSTAKVGVPVVVGTIKGWSVLFVRSRIPIDLNWEENRAEIVEQIQPYAAEFSTLKALRATSSIEVDTLLFNQIMAIEALR